MRDLVIDIQDPVFVMAVPGYSLANPSDVVEPVIMLATGTPNTVVTPGVAEVSSADEIMLLRAAAREAINDSRGT